MSTNKKYNSLKEVYEDCKNKVEGKMDYTESSNRDDDFIEWKFNERTSFKIYGDYFSVNSKYLKRHFHPEDNYNYIYELIMEWNHNFKSDSEYGKKSLIMKILIYSIIIIAVGMIAAFLKI